MGGAAGIVVLGLDIFKGFIAVWIANVSTHGNPVALALAASAVMVGHCYPVFLKFKGGKAVATFVGAFVYIAPIALAAIAGFFILVVAATKYISLGSLLAAFVFPFAFEYISHPPPALLAASIFAAALIIYRHRGNIERLRTGTEHPFSLRGKPV
jgi:glycerol-3-phosphate acyltransferase PlsY